MTISYTLGIPDGPHNPSNDQPNMKANNDANAAIIAVDHVGFNTGNSGYHTVIHETTQTTASTVSGINQIFSGVPGVLNVNSTLTTAIPPGGDTQLFTLTGAGILSQMTGKKTATNGYVWCAGILIQWGKKSLTSSGQQTGAITFSSSNVAFPNACFMVTVSLISNSSQTNSSDNTIAVRDGTVSATGFTWDFNGNGGSQPYVGFYWFAIGN